MILSAFILAIIAQPSRPLILAHYMPWYESKPVSGKWGWHWTMGHFDPDKSVKGRRQIASKLYPLIGPYDSNDPDALECQVQLMKLSGIDGVIIDWYGKEDVYDYATIHRNTLHLIKHIKRAGLKFAICFEDQTLPNLIKFKKVEEKNTVAHGKDLLNWVGKNWFKDPNYVRSNGKPVFLVFGPQFYKGPQWTEILGGHDVAIYGVNGKYDFSTDGYAWPYPKGGNERMQQFYRESSLSRGFIGIAYPRFDDIYAESKVHDSWGAISDDNGKTFADTYRWAVEAKSPIIQIATWNDWGEGTVVEPSVEYQYRDLETFQRARRQSDPAFKYKPNDLRLPIKLYDRRKNPGRGDRTKFDQASSLLTAGKVSQAAKLLK